MTLHVVRAADAPLDLAVPRLLDEGTLVSQVGPVAGLPVAAPGLVVGLVVPDDDRWALVEPARLASLGSSDEIWTTAYARLRADVASAERSPADIDDPWGAVTGFTSPSPHAASWLLVTDAVLAAATPGQDVSTGAVVAAPDRHRLVVMPCQGEPGRLRGPLMRAPHLVANLWHESSQPVSPHLYHWGPVTGLRQLTRYGRAAELVLPADLREWLARAA